MGYKKVITTQHDSQLLAKALLIEKQEPTTLEKVLCTLIELAVYGKLDYNLKVQAKDSCLNTYKVSSRTYQYNISKLKDMGLIIELDGEFRLNDACHIPDGIYYEHIVISSRYSKRGKKLLEAQNESQLHSL